MKKIKKILITAVVLIIVLVIGVAVVIGLNLDKIVKTAIVTVAPKITGTSVTLDGVGISPLTGSASISGLVVGNPSGYQTPAAISIGKAAVSVSPSSLLSDKIVVRSIEIRAPEITFEGNPLGNNNLKTILDNVNGASDAGAPAANQTAAANQPAKKLEVDDLLITGAKVHASITGLNQLTSLAGVATNVTISIPDIHLTNLGQGGDGITAASLAKTVLSQINAAAIKGVADYAKTNLTGAANDVIKEIKSGNGVDKIKKGLNGLLGK